MPEEYSSVFEPERPPPPKKPVVRAPQPAAQPMSQPQPQPGPEMYAAPRPVAQPVPQPIIEAKPAPQPINADNVFGLFNNPTEEKAEEHVNTILMNPLKPVGQPEPTLPPPQDDAVSKLNNIMRQMQLREEEEQKRKADQARQAAAMQQFATGNPMYTMNNMMVPQQMAYMTGMMNPMYGMNPYMTGYPGMNMPRPMGARPGSYQVKSL